MAASSFLPSNSLVAALPQRRRQQPSIHLQAMRERKAAWKADLAAKQVMLRGVSQGYAFTVVSAADRATLNAGPVVLLAKRRDTGEVAGVEASEAENRTRLNAWIDRAAVVPGIVLCAYRLAGSRVACAAVAADLSPKTARPSAFVTAGKYDLRAIMAAAIASAKVSRAKPLAKAWGACLSDALRDVWQAAKAARLAAAC